MKMTLTALAVLAAAGSAGAASVTLYGVADTGLMYARTSGTYANESALTMESGMNLGSRFGFKGQEDLGNGLTVGFKLENGFDEGTGKPGYNDHLFGREAQANLSGGFGTIAFGRMGGLSSSAGTFDILFATGDSFDGGDNKVGTGFAMTSRMDNTIAYASPEFAGFKVYAQYSLQADGTENAASSQNDRVASLGLTWNPCPAANLVMVVDNFKYAGSSEAYNFNSETDGWAYSFGGNADFGVTKVFFLGQWAQNVNGFANVDVKGELTDVFTGADGTVNLSALRQTGLDGYALHLGTVTPVAGGDFTVGVYFADGETSDTITFTNAEGAGAINGDVKYYGVSARYVYPLSKRTAVYTGAGFAQTNVKLSSAAVPETDREKVTQAYVGLTHQF